MNPYKVYDNTEKFAIDADIGFDAWEDCWDEEQYAAGTPLFRKSAYPTVSEFIKHIMDRMAEVEISNDEILTDLFDRHQS